MAVDLTVIGPLLATLMGGTFLGNWAAGKWGHANAKLTSDTARFTAQQASSEKYLDRLSQNLEKAEARIEALTKVQIEQGMVIATLTGKIEVLQAREIYLAAENQRLETENKALRNRNEELNDENEAQMERLAELMGRLAVYERSPQNDPGGSV